jgi:hypothetical protein
LTDDPFYRAGAGVLSTAGLHSHNVVTTRPAGDQNSLTLWSILIGACLPQDDATQQLFAPLRADLACSNHVLLGKHKGRLKWPLVPKQITSHLAVSTTTLPILDGAASSATIPAARAAVAASSLQRAHCFAAPHVRLLTAEQMCWLSLLPRLCPGPHLSVLLLLLLVLQLLHCAH